MEEREFRARLMTLRIIWAALLMGVMTFGVLVVLVLGPQRPPPADPSFPQLLLYIAIAMAVASMSGGFIARMIIWNKGRNEDGVVAPGDYATGNIIFWATCEGPTFFALVGALLNGGRGPHLIVAAITLAVMILSFPTGGPMRGSNV
jgi:hypothetical protein